MSKMEPLKTNRQYLIFLCILPADVSTSRRQTLAHIIFTTVILMGLMCCIAAGLAFGWKFVSIDLGRSIFALLFSISEFVTIYMAFVGMILLRHKIGTIFINLSAIYKDNGDAKSFRFLARVNNTSEWMWKIYFKIMAATLIMNFAFAPLISVLFNWVTNNDSSVENFFHPVPYVLPWNQTTPMGYIGELVYSVPGGFGYWFVNGTFLLLFISISHHHRAFYKMLRHSVRKLNQPDDNIQCDAKFLCDLMRFHISVKNWFFDTAEVYSPFIMVQLICSEIVLAISIFFLDYQIQENNFDVMAVTAALVGISNLLIYCYLGKLANESYAKMSDCIYNEMKWYEVPIGLQKYFILIIQNMQQPLYYHGFGVIYLNLETFTKLVKSAISYYMAIKALTLTSE